MGLRLPAFLKSKTAKAIVLAIAALSAMTFLRAADPAPIAQMRERTFDAYQQIRPRPYEEAPVRIVDIDEASLAAIGQWPDIASVTMLDHNPALRTLARKLADAGPLAAAEILSGDIGDDKPQSDLVVASYVLAELPEASASARWNSRHTAWSGRRGIQSGRCAG